MEKLFVSLSRSESKLDKLFFGFEIQSLRPLRKEIC